MPLEKTILMGQLFSIYKALLTDKQRDMLSLYYEEDFSLSEIAEHFDISRQGVYDNIRRGERALESYEELLKLKDKSSQRVKLLNKLMQHKHTDEANVILQQLMEIEE